MVSWLVIGRTALYARLLTLLKRKFLTAEPVCFGLLLLVYAATAAPSLTWAHYGADGGDLATAVVRRRLPHPPGFPVYLLIGRAALHIPWGDPAWRLNRLSAICAAGAAGLTVLAVRRLIPLSTGGSLVALGAGLSLGLAPLYWGQALITEVYAPAAFLTALLLALALWGVPPALLGLIWGVSTGVHPVLVWLAPLVAWGAASSAGQLLPVRTCKEPCFPDRRAGRKVPVSPLLVAGLMALGGWAATYGLLLPRLAQEPSPWGDLTTVTGWWAYVSGSLYHIYVFGLPLEFWPRRLLAWAGLMARQFTPAGVPLVLWGMKALWDQNRPLALAAGLTFAGFSLFAAGYNTTDSLVYLVPALPVAAVWLGAGWQKLLKIFSVERRCLRFACLLLPLTQVAWHWSAMDLHRDRVAVVWAGITLRAAPAGATLVTTQDAATFALWYAQDVLGVRTDVRIVDRGLWNQPSYRIFLAARWRTSPTRVERQFLSEGAKSPLLPVHMPAGATP